MRPWTGVCTDRRYLRLDHSTPANLLVAVISCALAYAARATLAQPVDVESLSSSPWQAQIDSLAAVENELRAPAAPNATSPAVCVIVRTFWGHGGKNMEERQQGLRSLLASLRAQKNLRYDIA